VTENYNCPVTFNESLCGETLNKRGNVHITMRCICATTVAVEKQ